MAKIAGNLIAAMACGINVHSNEYSEYQINNGDNAMGHALTLECPNCRNTSESKVTSTRIDRVWSFSNNSNTVLNKIEGRVRARFCTNCKTPFNTIEIPITSYFEEIEEEIEKGNQFLKIIENFIDRSPEINNILSTYIFLNISSAFTIEIFYENHSRISPIIKGILFSLSPKEIVFVFSKCIWGIVDDKELEGRIIRKLKHPSRSHKIREIIDISEKSG